MGGLNILVKRNVKLFFKDKGLFFTSLITPLILLVLYATFLSKMFRSSFNSSMPEEMRSIVSKRLINGFIGGQLTSSLLSVSCITVAFCSNMIMANDKMTNVIKDINVTPVNKSKIAIAYYLGTLLNTLLVCYFALVLCLGYCAIIGWYLSFLDVIMLIVDVLLLVLFGTALSSIVNCFLSTQGQISAVGTIVSSCYGFISGAYMPISQFGKGLANLISCLPGTYGTSLMREHSMRGALAEMEKLGFPADTIKGIRDAVDCNIYFFSHKVPQAGSWGILVASIIVFMGIYILINYLRKNKKLK